MTGQLSYKTNNGYVRNGLPRVPPLSLLLLLLIKMPPPTMKTAQLRSCRVPTDLPNSSAGEQSNKRQHQGGGSPCKTKNASECNTDSRYKLRIPGTLYLVYDMRDTIAMGIVYVRTAAMNLQVSIVYVPL